MAIQFLDIKSSNKRIVQRRKMWRCWRIRCVCVGGDLGETVETIPTTSVRLLSTYVLHPLRSVVSVKGWEYVSQLCSGGPTLKLPNMVSGLRRWPIVGQPISVESSKGIILESRAQQGLCRRVDYSDTNTELHESEPSTKHVSSCGYQQLGK